MVQGSGAVTVTGTGSVSSPYIVSASLNLAVLDSPTLDLSISGDGSLSSPWVISGAVNLDLNGLTDVNTAGSTTGQVLAKQADGTFSFVAPTTAPTGAINLSSTGGLQGDGSAGNPLAIKLSASSGLILDSTGLRVSGGGAWTPYTPTLTATSSNPAIGNGSLNAAYSQQGKTVDVNIEINIGSTTTRGVGYWMVSLPVAPEATRTKTLPVLVAVPGVANYVGVAYIAGNTRIERILIATSTAAGIVSHSLPSSLPAGSNINISGTYEAA